MPHFPFKRRHVDRIETARAVARVAFAHGLAGIVFTISWGTGLFAADGAKTAAVDGSSFPPAAVEFFEARVRPILVDQCVKCHGPKKQSSGLRLDSRDAMLKGGDSGPAVVPSKADESLLIQAVTHTHAELKMPPSGKLSEPAVAILRQWVSLGAPWSVGAAKGSPEVGASASSTAVAAAHWAFQPVRRGPADGQRPGMGSGRLVDAFVLARLEAAGLAPSHEADKRTLIRRATIDLWGIPPTAEEVDAFESDTCTRRFRPAGRSSAGFATVWRALGPALARRRPLRRHQGLCLHAGPALSLRLHLPRLRDRGVQCRPRLRPVHRSSRSRPINSLAATTTDRWRPWGF